ncbi:MAG: Endonuclease III [Chloroflexi bacterium]|nr:Endonuclease III [Chloroflexota bacterium]
MRNEVMKDEFAQEIHTRLMAHYGSPSWRPSLSPVAELVSTILSQNTNDTNRDRGFDQLRERFPTWEEVRDAPQEEIIDAIRVAGLANQKGPRIQNALREITQECGKISLDFLEDMSLEEADAWLQNLKGVGPKTASIVLLFALNRPAFPVDTHIHRVTGRVGLLPPKMSANKAHEYLAEQFPVEAYYPVHLNLIKLGREICTARKTHCSICPLEDICQYEDKY